MTKNLRDSANIVRSMARQYQAVIDLAEHVGEGDKLEAANSDAEKRLKAKEEEIEAAKRKLATAQKAFEDMQAKFNEHFKKLDEQRTALEAEQSQLGEAIKERIATVKALDDTQGLSSRKIDAAQKQLLNLQGTINEKKDELSRLQDKISKVQEAIAKVA